MGTFLYRARDRGKQTVEGRVAAETEQDALAKLGEMGYFPLSIEPEDRGAPRLPQRQSPGRLSKIRRRDVTFVTRQLADLLGSGLTLMRSLDVLREQTEHPRVQEVLAEVAADVREGRS